DRERQEGGRVAGELLFAEHGPAGQEALAGQEPRERAAEQEHDHGAEGDLRRGRALERRRTGGAARPGPEDAEELEENAGEEPERKPAAEAAQRGGERDPPPPAAREEVDGGGEEREQRRDQHELERPAAHDPLAEVDVARRALRELEALVERAQELLRGAADLRESVGVEALRRVSEGRRRPVRSGRQRHGRKPARDERRLL